MGKAAMILEVIIIVIVLYLVTAALICMPPLAESCLLKMKPPI